jgi:CRP-like cAMP-binding protein
MNSAPLSQNDLLASLSLEDFEYIRPNLRSIDLIGEAVLVEVGGAITRVYFPQSGIISFVVRLATGDAVEVAMVGRDGAFGAAPALDGQISPNTAVVQMAGKALALDVPLLQIAAEHSVSFRAALIRYEQVIQAQALQSAACNASHSVESRLSRWLLRARDLTGCDTLAFSQESLAQMLGRHRNSVSIVASSLQEAGLIRYSRGQIEITDLEGLMKRSCECYGTLRTRSDELLRRV